TWPGSFTSHGPREISTVGAFQWSDKHAGKNDVLMCRSRIGFTPIRRYADTPTPRYAGTPPPSLPYPDHHLTKVRAARHVFVSFASGIKRENLIDHGPGPGLFECPVHFLKHFPATDVNP